MTAFWIRILLAPHTSCLRGWRADPRQLISSVFTSGLLVLRICISQKGISANHLLRKVWLQQPKGQQPLKDKASRTLSPSPEGFYSTLRMGVLADTALEKRWSRRNSFEFGFSQKVQENGALGNKSTPAISSAPPTPTLTYRDKEQWTAMLLLVSHFHSSHKKQWENSLLPEGRLYLTTRKWSSQLSWKPSNSHCLQSLLPKI